MFARLKLSAISCSILLILCTKGENKRKFCLNGGIPECLFLTFLNPGPSTISAVDTSENEHIEKQNNSLIACFC